MWQLKVSVPPHMGLRIGCFNVLVTRQLVSERDPRGPRTEAPGFCNLISEATPSLGRGPCIVSEVLGQPTLNEGATEGRECQGAELIGVSSEAD